MNSLTWILYLIGVLPNISGVFITMAVILVTGWVMVTVAHWASEREVSKPKFLLLILAGVFSLLGAVIPSENTMYLMLASEVGEHVATTEAGEKVLSDVQEIVTLKLAEIKEGIEKK